MARHLFGGDIAAYVVAPGDEVTGGDPEVTGNQVLLVPSSTVTFWSAETAGTQYTDLLDALDTPITSVTSDADGAIPQLRGPDGITVMWAQAGEAGARRLIVATDLGADVTALQATVATLQGAVDTLTSYAQLNVYRDAGTGAWPTRPAGASRVWWIETQPGSPSPPTIGGSYMLDGLDYYVGQAGA